MWDLGRIVAQSSRKGHWLFTTSRNGSRCMANLVQASEIEPEVQGDVKPFEAIPKIPYLPLLGVTWAYMPIIGKYRLREMNLAYGKKFEEYGKIVREDFTKKIRTVLLYDVRDFEKYFRQEGREADRILFDTIRIYRDSRPEYFLGGGLAATSGDQWYNMRSKVQPHLLRPREIHSYLPGIDGISQEFLNQVPSLVDDKNEVVDFRKELTRWGIESIGLIGLDTRLGALSNSEDSLALIKAGDNMFTLFHQLEFGFSHLWRLFPTPAYKRLIKEMDFFSEISMKHIKAAAKRLEENEDKDHKLTLLETFLTKENMDPRLANTMIMDMLLAGVDTTSTTVNFVLYHLARNPDVQEKAFQEVSRVMAGENQVNTTVLNEIRYLKSCVKESMRITPTVSAFPRTLREDMVFSGYKIPAGVMVMFAISVACKLESNFKNAMEFQPERWIGNKDHNPFTFMPFGFGVRSCIGRRIAEIEMQTLLIRILQKYRIEYHYEDVECVMRLVNVPKRPLKLRFIRR